MTVHRDTDHDHITVSQGHSLYDGRDLCYCVCAVSVTITHHNSRFRSYCMMVTTKLLNFNTLPIYRKRSKRFAKILKGAPTYSMVLKQSVLGGVRGRSVG